MSSALSSTRSPGPAWRMAWANPRKIDQELVDAYLARRALDYLWASTCRLCCGASCLDRARRAACSPWRCASSATAKWRSRPSRPRILDGRRRSGRSRRPVHRRLTGLDGDKITQMSIKDEASAIRAKAAIQSAALKVASVESKPVRRNPPPALHHLQPPDGRRPQAWLQRQAHHAGRQKLYEASMSAARRSASSPICEPTALILRRKPSWRCATR